MRLHTAFRASFRHLTSWCATAIVVMAPAVSHAQAASAGPRGITISALAHQARVHTALDDLMPPERTVPQVGLELGVPTFWRPLRLTGRMLRATSGGDDLQSMDAGLLLAGRHVAVEAAYSTRASYSPTTGLAHSRTAEFGRAGLRGQMALGATGFTLHLRGTGYIPTRRAPDPSDDVQGWDAESGLTYQPLRFPVNATLGYRLERFRIFGVEQEVSALTLALGFTLLGR